MNEETMERFEEIYKKEYRMMTSSPSESAFNALLNKIYQELKEDSKEVIA